PALARRGVRPARPAVLRLATQRRRFLRARGPQPERVRRMDRLPALIAAAAAALAGCDSGSSAPGEKSSRVDSVKGKARRVSAEELCDVRHPDDRAQRFALPPLAGPAPAA